MSRTRLACVLALTALPVVLTTVALRILDSRRGAAVASPYLDFAVYAVANWITFALVVCVAGWAQLRLWGLRFRISRGRGLGAIAGFIGGLVIYGLVSAALARWHLPPVRGMDFAAPSAVELAVLFLSVAVTAAFCEEVFFRVLWIGGLGSLVPGWIAGAIAIVAFAAIHYPYFGVGGVIFISVWAILPVALFLVWDDITAPLAMHVMNNVFAYIIVPLLFPKA